jgi:hypothetical protein
MGRIVLMSAHLRERGVSTPTVLIDKLAEALQATVKHVLQSAHTFDINSPLQLEFQLQLGDSRGNGSIRFFRLEVESFIRGGVWILTWGLVKVYVCSWPWLWRLFDLYNPPKGW